MPWEGIVSSHQGSSPPQKKAPHLFRGIFTQLGSTCDIVSFANMFREVWLYSPFFSPPVCKKMAYESPHIWRGSPVVFSHADSPSWIFTNPEAIHRRNASHHLANYFKRWWYDHRISSMYQVPNRWSDLCFFLVFFWWSEVGCMMLWMHKSVKLYMLYGIFRYDFFSIPSKKLRDQPASRLKLHDLSGALRSMRSSRFLIWKNRSYARVIPSNAYQQ